jgi:signal transduction histidine kinase
MTVTPRITVLLADDHTVVRQGLCKLLEDERDIEVVGEAGSGRDAVELTASLRPAVVVMDIAMPKSNGLEATRRIRELSPDAKVLILSAHADDVFVHGDSSALEHMVLNLLINAMEAAVDPSTGSGQAEVRLRLTTNDAGSVRLTVENTGPGPSREIADRIFEPFVTDKKDGIGLGLAVVHEVVTDHQGQIHWDQFNDADTGALWTRFIVEMPIAEEGKQSATTAGS